MRVDPWNRFFALAVAAAPLACSAWCAPRTADQLDCSGTRGTGLGQTGVDGGNARCSNFSEFGLTCEEDFQQVGAFDIIWVVDNSGSMTEELRGVKDHVNSFAQTITRSGVDFHIIMVSDKGTGGNDICVPEPLAGPNCEGSSVYMPVDEFVASTDGPEVLVAAAQDLDFQAFVRPGSRRAIIFVTDDNSQWSASRALGEIATSPALSGAVIHAVVGTNAQDCPDLADEGTEYMAMAQQTGGLVLPICCSDYAQLVNALALDVTQQNGRFTLEKPAVPSSVRVYTVDATNTRNAVRDGWTYDENLRAVVFDAASIPAAGTRLVITYSSRN